MARFGGTLAAVVVWGLKLRAASIPLILKFQLKEAGSMDEKRDGTVNGTQGWVVEERGTAVIRSIRSGRTAASATCMAHNLHYPPQPRSLLTDQFEVCYRKCCLQRSSVLVFNIPVLALRASATKSILVLRATSASKSLKPLPPPDRNKPEQRDQRRTTEWPIAASLLAVIMRQRRCLYCCVALIPSCAG